MKVKFIKDCDGQQGEAFKSGEVYELETARAERAIAKGLCIEFKESKPKTKK